MTLTPIGQHSKKPQNTGNYSRIQPSSQIHCVRQQGEMKNGSYANLCKHSLPLSDNQTAISVGEIGQ